MKILTRVERTIKLNSVCIEELLDKYALDIDTGATAVRINREDVLRTVQKLQEANNSLVILRASIRGDDDDDADDQQET